LPKKQITEELRKTETKTKTYTNIKGSFDKFIINFYKLIKTFFSFFNNFYFSLTFYRNILDILLILR
jgi:hypothetical protein